MRASSTLFATGEPAYAVNRDGIIRAWNCAAENAFGYARSVALGQHCWELLAGQDLFGNRYCCAGCPLREMAFDHQLVNSNEMRFVTADKKLQRFRVTRLLIACDSGNELLVHLCRRQSEPEEGTAAGTGHTPNNSGNRGALTNREVEVLALLARGLSTRELASRLNISPATVRNHVRNIFVKLDVHNRVAAVRHGCKLGLIRLDS
jgi:DNA-binding CsgD family transcriptional regulator